MSDYFWYVLYVALCFVVIYIYIYIYIICIYIYIYYVARLPQGLSQARSKGRYKKG